jgi:hypothetical protein
MDHPTPLLQKDSTMADDRVELKPCPNVLCDLSRPFLNETDADLNATHTWVSCENCGACGPRIENPSQYFGRTEHWEEVKRQAVEAWNTRAAISAHTPVVRNEGDIRNAALEEAAAVAEDRLRDEADDYSQAFNNGVQAAVSMVRALSTRDGPNG